MTTRKTAPALKVGDKVRLLRATRRNAISAGTIGRVVEVRDGGSPYTDGVSVEFMKAPSPRIAVLFGKDPNALEPYRCLFPTATVARMLSRV